MNETFFATEKRLDQQAHTFQQKWFSSRLMVSSVKETCEPTSITFLSQGVSRIRGKRRQVNFNELSDHLTIRLLPRKNTLCTGLTLTPSPPSNILLVFHTRGRRGGGHIVSPHVFLGNWSETWHGCYAIIFHFYLIKSLDFLTATR